MKCSIIEWAGNTRRYCFSTLIWGSHQPSYFPSPNEWIFTFQFPQLLFSFFLGHLTQSYFCMVKPHFCYRSRGSEEPWKGGKGSKTCGQEKNAVRVTRAATIFWRLSLWPSLCQVPCLWFSQQCWVVGVQFFLFPVE